MAGNCSKSKKAVGNVHIERMVFFLYLRVDVKSSGGKLII